MSTHVTRYLTISFLLVLVLNVPVLRDMKWQNKKSTAPIVDPSGYYNLTHPEEKENTVTAEDNDKKSAPFMANFFGMPAIIISFGLLLGFKKSGNSIPVLKQLIFLTLAWIIFEAMAYTTLLVSAFTMSLGIVVMPVLGALAMFLFMKLISYFFSFQWNRSTLLYAFLTLMLLILPLAHFFMAYQASVVTSLTILLWLGVLILAVQSAEKKKSTVETVLE